MKRIIGVGVVALALAGCVTTTSGVRTAKPEPEGWYAEGKTSAQLSKDLDECRMRCLGT
jgi:PBP1b-binding outer membrane lipoprotein LpoB